MTVDQAKKIIRQEWVKRDCIIFFVLASLAMTKPARATPGSVDASSTTVVVNATAGGNIHRKPVTMNGVLRFEGFAGAFSTLAMLAPAETGAPLSIFSSAYTIAAFAAWPAPWHLATGATAIGIGGYDLAQAKTDHDRKPKILLINFAAWQVVGALWIAAGHENTNGKLVIAPTSNGGGQVYYVRRF